MSLQIAQTVAAMRQARAAAAPHSPIALVPTMGALHEGHRSLIRAARQQAKTVVVSIFVNPTQFGPTEDFAQYPRTFDADLALLERESVDILFAPTPEEMYPPTSQITPQTSTTDPQTSIDPGPIATRLDGASRPGHFRGVATVVLKLFNIVTPDIAFFGQKDAAQCAVLQAMVRDLNLPVHLHICPTVRDPDGLALSSRNQYLTPAERHVALALSRALRAAEQQAAHGITSAATLRQTLLTTLAQSPNLKLDYAALVDPRTLLPLETTSQGALIAIAAWIGKTRLIDNILLPPATR